MDPLLDISVMQPLTKPHNGRVLRLPHSFHLGRVVGISSDGKCMLQSWKVMILIRDAEGGKHAIAEELQLLCEHRVEFRRHDLYWHTNRFNFGFLKEAWVGCGNAIHEVSAFSP